LTNPEEKHAREPHRHKKEALRPGSLRGNALAATFRMKNGACHF